MERKRRLVYGFWALIVGALLLTALRSLWSEPWPRPLAHDQVLLVTRLSEEELWQIDPYQPDRMSPRPWEGRLVKGASKGALWQYENWESGRFTQFRMSDWHIAKEVHAPPRFEAPILTPDGKQIQMLSVAEPHGSLRWLDVADGAQREAPIPCDSEMTLLQPLRRDEAILLCLWELWAVEPGGNRPLLTPTTAPAQGCEHYAGRPFAVATDHKRQRLWLTGEGGLLCQIDPRSGTLRKVAQLPIAESERVSLGSIHHVPATDLLYIGLHPWDVAQKRRILVWDLRQNLLRAELNLTDPLLALHPSSDGAHLYGLTDIRPGESATRLVLINAATGEVERELGKFEGFLLDWAILPD